MSVNKNLNAVHLISSESNDRHTKPNCTLGEDYRVTTKRKAKTNLKSPSNSKKVVVLAETVKRGTKRKAVTETETPNKRPTSDSGHTGKDTEVSAIDQPKTSDGELLVQQTPTTKKRAVGKHRPTIFPENLMFPENIESNDSHTKPNCTLGEDYRVLTKRKAKTNHKSPSNSQKVVVLAETVKRGTKRKAVTETETPNKRPTSDSGHTGKDTEVSAIDQPKTSDGELLVQQTPTTKKRAVGKHRPTTFPENLMFPENVESNDSHTKPNCTLGEDYRVLTKRKAKKNHKSPSNSQKVVVLAETVKRGTKRKAVTETETPNKRPTSDSGHTGKDTEVSAIDQPKTSDGELLVQQTPTTNKRAVGKHRPTIFPENLLFPENVESNDSHTKPNCTLGEDYRVLTKRKAKKNHKSPSNSQKVVVLAETVKRGTKRKAVTETETPNKRPTSDSGHTGKDTEVSAIDQPKTSDGELLVQQTPTTNKRAVGKHRPTIFPENLLFPENVADLEDKYVEMLILGEGGFGRVLSGYRKADSLPVAFKHIPKKKVTYYRKMINGKIYKIPLEVLLMQTMTSGAPLGASVTMSLLDWFEVGDEVILVIERPIPAVELTEYLTEQMSEHEAKPIMKQLVNAAIDMCSKRVFHRDLKRENILIEPGTTGPRVRIIDFGCGCLVKGNALCTAEGTVQYLPPECFRDWKLKAEPTTVWQLGAILCEMLSDEDDLFDSFSLIFPVNVIGNMVDELNVSQVCKDLLIKCLNPSPTLRITLGQMASHPWFNYTQYQQSQNLQKTQQWTSFYNSGDGFHLEIVTVKQIVRLHPNYQL